MFWNEKSQKMENWKPKRSHPKANPAFSPQKTVCQSVGNRHLTPWSAISIRQVSDDFKSDTISNHKLARGVLMSRGNVLSG